MPEINPFELGLNWCMRCIVYGRMEHSMSYLSVTADDIKELCPIPLYGTEEDSKWQREEDGSA